MAIKRLTIDGYGQVELNQVAFRRDGRIEAQCALDSTAFSSVPCENGMLLAVDNISRTVAPTSNSALPIGLVYSAEHMYDERNDGLKDFKIEYSEDGYAYPRIGYLAVGDKFTTNCVCYDDTTYTTESAFISALTSLATTKLYGGIDASGAIAVASSSPSVGPKLLAVKKTTMPDGTLGIKFQCVAD